MEAIGSHRNHKKAEESLSCGNVVSVVVAVVIVVTVVVAVVIVVAVVVAIVIAVVSKLANFLCHRMPKNDQKVEVDLLKVF